MEHDQFDLVAEQLAGARLEVADFRKLILEAGDGDLVFADPPYTVHHNTNAFDRYNERLFSWHDQEVLATALVDAKNRGAIVLCTNACHKSVIELYKEDFNITKISRQSSISGKTLGRGKFEEILITSEDLL